MTETSVETAQVDPSDWTFEMDGHTFPFVEDDCANITGLGHQDKAEFAAAINRYDEVCNGEPFPEDEQWDAGYIAHKWAVLVEGEDHELRLYAKRDGLPVGPDAPGAVAITTLWNQR